MRTRNHPVRGMLAVLVLLLCSGMLSYSRPAVTRAAAVHVTAFYTISKSTYDAWSSGSPTPMKTNTFAPGTANVGY